MVFISLAMAVSDPAMDDDVPCWFASSQASVAQDEAEAPVDISPLFIGDALACDEPVLPTLLDLETGEVFEGTYERYSEHDVVTWPRLRLSPQQPYVLQMEGEEWWTFTASAQPAEPPTADRTAELAYVRHRGGNNGWTFGVQTFDVVRVSFDDQVLGFALPGAGTQTFDVASVGGSVGAEVCVTLEARSRSGQFGSPYEACSVAFGVPSTAPPSTPPTGCRTTPTPTGLLALLLLSLVASGRRGTETDECGEGDGM